MEWTFEGSIIYWRGPAPFYFVPLSEDVVADIAPVANQLTYGWGCIPVQATTVSTSEAAIPSTRPSAPDTATTVIATTQTSNQPAARRRTSGARASATRPTPQSRAPTAG